MLPADAAYLAGLIDGEGYIGVTRTDTSKSAKGCRKGFSYRVNVSIKMTGRQPLDFARLTSGIGTVRPCKLYNPKHRPAYVWGVWSNEACDFLKEIRPYLKLKAQQADITMAFQALLKTSGRPGLSDEEWDSRERLYLEMRKLNKRGA